MGGKDKFCLEQVKEVFSGRVFDLREETWRAPDGKTFCRQTVVHNGAVAMVPFLSPRRLVMLDQFRPATGGWFLEIPAGAINKGENPLPAAKRELKEEIGRGARRWLKLGEIFSAPGFCNEKIHLYKAWDLYEEKLPGDDDEYIRTVVMSPAELRRAARSGRLCDAKTLSALLLLDVL